jgi:hypothetical protein
MRGIEAAITELLALQLRMNLESASAAVPGAMVANWSQRLSTVINALSLPAPEKTDG